MNCSYTKYLIIKLCSLISFFIFHYAISSYHNQFKASMSFSYWYIFILAIVINVSYGELIGCFFYYDIKIYTSKRINVIITITILTVLSVYQLLYFAPFWGNFLCPFFLPASKYFQWSLVFYLLCLVPHK